MHVNACVLAPNHLGTFTCEYGSDKAVLHVLDTLMGEPHWFDTHMPGTVTGFGDKDRYPPKGVGDYRCNWPIHTNKPTNNEKGEETQTRASGRRRRAERRPQLPAALRDTASHPPPSLIDGVEEVGAGSLQPDFFRPPPLEQGEDDFLTQALFEGAQAGFMCPEPSTNVSMADLDLIEPPVLIPEIPGL